jgi:adenine deaminase
VDYEEALSRLQLGMAVLVREGSTERNLDLILEGVVREGTYSHHLMFCTDDKHPDEILEEGHIDFMVNRAIELGLDPIQAIQMATINAAKHFRIEHLVGSLSPGRWADILLVEDLKNVTPKQVFYKGKQVVDEGKYIGTPPEPDFPGWLFNTVKIKAGKSPEDFIVPYDQDTAKVWVIDLFPDQIINTRTEADLKVLSGAVQSDPERDILKLSVVERHGKNGNIGTSFVKGFGLKNGALASSIAHDHHNIIVAGTNDRDMALCVKTLEEIQGGFVIVADGEVLGKLPLPIGGLLSEEPVDAIISGLEEINHHYHELGGTLPAPFMTISFIGLPTVPDLGLSDLGLIDVFAHKLISPFVKEERSV